MFVGTSKKVVICTNCKKKEHIKENCWAKGGGKEGQGPCQKKQSKPKKKKGKMKVNGANESSSNEPDEPITFINFDCTALIKDSTGTTQILDTGASSHIVRHLTRIYWKVTLNFPSQGRFMQLTKGPLRPWASVHL